MFCSNCGKEITENGKFCPSCGETLEPEKVVTQPKNKKVSEKNRTIAALLAFFLGGVGAHRFYVGKAGTAVLTILLTCCFGIGYIWAFVDLIMILCGNFKDKDGLLVLDWNIQ